MKGSTGLLVFGVLIGMVGALVAVKLRRAHSDPDVDSLAERIQAHLEELEGRIKGVASEA